MVLEKPAIPLHINTPENDLRACVTKHRISGGTMSSDGRETRNVMLGLMKTCRKLGIFFFAYWVTGSASMGQMSASRFSEAPCQPACTTLPGKLPSYV